MEEVMKKIISFFIFIFISFHSLIAQTPTIQLETFTGLNTIDFAAFAFTNGLSGAPRIFHVIITPVGRNIIVKGQIDWKKDETTGFTELADFTTVPFISRNFYNDEIGNSEIKIASSNVVSSVRDDIFSRGKPTGVYQITLNMLDVQTNQKLSSDQKEISFLNPAQTISIQYPVENGTYDMGNVQAIWTPVQGAASYKIRANVMPAGSSSPEDALSGSSPLINDRDVGIVNVANLGSILDRQWVAGQRIVLSVTAIIEGPGGGTLLPSPPVTFHLSSSRTVANNPTVDPNLVRLAVLMTGQVNQNFINKLLDGEITVENIQITDESNNSLTFSNFLTILTYLETNKMAIKSINFTPN
jgi:hypothetical protein